MARSLPLTIRESGNRVLTSASLCMVLGAAFGVPLHAQLVIKLAPQTVTEYDRYAQIVEASLNDRWQGKKNFLYVEDDAENKKRVLRGEIFIKQMAGGHPVEITQGLIHDWLGAIYIPHTTLDRVLYILQDFDNHKNIYPEVSDSRTIRRDGNDITGYWRLQQKGIVPIVLEVEQQAHYQQIASGKWKCQAYARNITEVDTGLFSRGRKFPIGKGHGYLWRLYAYWSLESFNGGVLAECRTLSLSRDIPEGLSWAVAPYVQKMPQDSITSSLTETRKAASK